MVHRRARCCGVRLHGFPKADPARNLFAYSSEGILLWRAEDSGQGATDAYTNVLSEWPLRVGNFAGFSVQIEEATGRVISKFYEMSPNKSFNNDMLAATSPNRVYEFTTFNRLIPEFCTQLSAMIGEEKFSFNPADRGWKPAGLQAGLSLGITQPEAVFNI